MKYTRFLQPISVKIIFIIRKVVHFISAFRFFWREQLQKSYLNGFIGNKFEETVVFTIKSVFFPTYLMVKTNPFDGKKPIFYHQWATIFPSTNPLTTGFHGQSLVTAGGSTLDRSEMCCGGPWWLRASANMGVRWYDDMHIMYDVYGMYMVITWGLYGMYMFIICMMLYDVRCLMMWCYTMLYDVLWWFMMFYDGLWCFMMFYACRIFIPWGVAWGR